MGRPIKLLEVTEAQRAELLEITSRPTSLQRMVERAKIVLLRSQGIRQKDVAIQVKVQTCIVSKWEKRFRLGGVGGLEEAHRSGRKPSISDEVRAQVIAEATRPPEGRSRWSTRSMARAKGISSYTVQKIWSANGIQPHLKRTFKLSRDPLFEPKFWDVIGLYLDPPDRALVLCCDEKSQCQALERTQPGLPLGVGHIRTATHDYIRHGTVTLFAALDYLSGKIHHTTAARHTNAEWLAFLKHLDKVHDADLSLHLILDNYGAHKHPSVKKWVKWRNQRHRKKYGIDRIVEHFTPTSSSWMNLVERFFRDLTVDCVRDGSFGSVAELVASMTAYLAERNLKPTRYEWKADGRAILEKIQRARMALGQAENRK
jgi:transposase